MDVKVPLPSPVYRCIQFLDAKNAILEEGIFRLSGSNVVVKQLRERFNTEGDINLVTDEQYYDIHAVASLLKLYLRELPTTILTRDLHLEFLGTTELPTREAKLAALQILVQRLPLANATLLKYLLAFLIKIINNADMNKMTVRNVGIVFSPTLNIPAPVFAIFLQNYEAVFGMEPEDYELPSPASEAETHGYGDAGHAPRFEPPRRPSTSSGSASPARTTQRSTPTPPLVGRQTYEPAYMGQSARPGSSTGRSKQEAMYEQSNMHSSRGAPGYERQHGQSSGEDANGNLAAYDTTNRRRESAIFMGGMMNLQQQGSKSRLREETRF
jgi:RalA-binding protein 1